MKSYIGLDAHSTTCTFVVVNHHGKIIQSSEVDSNEKSLIQEIKKIPGPKMLALEVSTISKWLYALFKDEVDELIVCEPGNLHRRKGKKTDFLDGERLAQMLRGGFLKSVFHEESFFYDLRRVVNAYRKLVWDIAALKCRYRALFRSSGLTSQGGGFYFDLTQLERLEKPTDQQVGQSIFVQLSCMEQEKERYKQYFNKVAKKEKQIRVLKTIPGISTVRATTIAAAVCSPERFETKYKFWSYSMLVRHRLISGGNAYGSTRVRARCDLKDVYMGAAETVLKHREPSALRKVYDRLRTKGVDHRKAKKTIARKIAAISLKLMKSGEKYNEKLV